MARQIFTLVGAKHRGTEDIVAKLSPGAEMLLRREPGNPHDRNAVMIFGSGLHLGYVKGTEAGGLARQMDASGITEVRGAYRVTGDRWPQVEVDL